MALKKIKIYPVKKIKGQITLPGDKSISHRAVIFGALAMGRTKIKNFLVAQDALATISCFKKIGVRIKINHKKKIVEINGRGVSALKKPQGVLDVGNSGTTIRILTGLLSGLPFDSKIQGDQSVVRRPMNRVVKPLRLMGAKIFGRQKNGEIYPPLGISGRKLKGIKYNLPIASAQVKSALLLAGFNAAGVTEIKEPALSRDHTERMFKFFGRPLKKRNGYLQIKAGADLKAKNIEIPGDFSSAAFFMVAALILPGSKIILEKVGLNPGRAGLLQVLEKMGGKIKIKNIRYFGGEPVGDLEVCSSKLWGLGIGGRIIPTLIDEIPVIAVAAIFARGKTVIKNAAELRVKESDRIKSIAVEFKKMGAGITERPDGLIIQGLGSTGANFLKGARVKSHGDHRIAMALAIAGLRAKGPTIIEDTACIGTSFPEFLSLLKKIVAK